MKKLQFKNWLSVFLFGVGLVLCFCRPVRQRKRTEEEINRDLQKKWVEFCERMDHEKL
jgi:hypothetical protein